MTKASNYLENKLVDHILRGVSFTAPTGVYVSLHSADPTDLGTGVEVTGTNYSRVLVLAATGNWAGTQSAGSTENSSGTGGLTTNNAAITFPTPSGAWGTVGYFGMWDAMTAGNLLIYGDLGTPKTINALDSAPVFASGALSVTVA